MLGGEIRSLRLLASLNSVGARMVVVIVALGCLSSLLEGIGIYLFLPLLNVLSGDTVGTAALPAQLRPLFAGLPEGWLVPAIAGLVLLSIVLKNLVTYANAWLFAVMNCGAGHEIRTRLYRQILYASAAHIEAEGSSRVSNTMLSESWNAVEAMGVVFRLVIETLTALALIGVLVVLSWRGTLLVVPISGLLLGALYVLTRANRRAGQEAVEANRAFVRHLWESVEGLPTIRVFGRREQEIAGFGAVSDTVRRVYLRLQMIGSLVGPVFEVMAACAMALWVIALYALGTSLTSIAVFALVVHRLQPRLRNIAGARAQLLRLSGPLAELEAVGAACAASALVEGTRPLPEIRHGIAFRDVSFRYASGKARALEGIDLTLRRNEAVAIVGRSGAGKSTLIKLLCRSMDPTGGQILVDGHDLRDVRLDDWVGRIGMVAQEVHLFNRTVAENIAYGMDHVDRAEVEAAARLAKCHAFITELPRGYDTEVGDKGARLSGGQRQRIALARALIRKPDLLILDEATNALDMESELAIQGALQALRSRMTLVIIAHRLSSVRSADRVVVLENGRIVQQGPLAQMEADEGSFARLFQLH